MIKLKMNGGKVIDSGGFGCVFYPSLKCKGKKHTRKHKKISKLMRKNKALDEMNEIQNAYNYIKKIPNYSKYFLIKDINICEPEHLSDEDLIHFEKCENLLSIYKRNINKNLDRYKIINMPYGGKTVGTLLINIAKEKDNHTFYILNNSLIKLFYNAILQINKINYFHGDLKSNNVLYEIKRNKIQLKIIDFGLSFVYEKDKIINRRLQLNSPMSIVLLQENNIQYINDTLSYLSVYEPYEIENRMKEKIEEIIDQIVYTLYTTEEGHYEYMSNLFEIIYEGKIQFNTFLKSYFTKVLETYINKYTFTFEAEKYYKSIFLKNIDICGFLSIYNKYIFSYDGNDVYKDTIPKNIIEILKKYVYNIDYSIKEIPVNELIKDLKNIYNIENKKKYTNNIKTRNTKILNSKKTKTKKTKTKKTKN